MVKRSATTRKTKFLRSAPKRSADSANAFSQAVKADLEAQTAKIQNWDDERAIGNGIIVTLKPGIYFYDDCGVMGFDDERSARTAISKATGRS